MPASEPRLPISRLNGYTDTLQNLEHLESWQQSNYI